MIADVEQIIELTEYVAAELPRESLSDDLGEKIWRNFRTQISVEFPGPPTGGKWRLTSQGYVGHIPLSKDHRILLRPKVELGNLFRMMEYAYSDIKFFSDLTGCESLEEFYESLANILASKVLSRARKGFYREYVGERERLPYVRGRLDIASRAQAPWTPHLCCDYEEHTADNAENQILAWTLFVIARSGLCSERVQATLRSAYRGLQGFASLTPWSHLDCVNRLYNRLNEDYQSLHALCRFFLEHSGPCWQAGSHSMLPFLVDMARLFEVFVEKWMKSHLSQGYTVREQEHISIGGDSGMKFIPDLVLYNSSSGAIQCILDTKYKAPNSPSPDDIAKVIAYAEAVNCREAALIYPTPLPKPFDSRIGDIHVRTLVFSLEGDLDRAGQKFFEDLFSDRPADCRFVLKK